MAAKASSTFETDNKVLKTLQNLPFENLIAAPLNACVNAQAEAAQSTINFIQSVGLNEDENGNKEAVYVYFNFIQGGRRVTISVPLLTMVPIPYIAINSIEINFKAKVTGVQSENNTASNSFEKNEKEKKYEGKLGWFKVNTTTLNTEVSTKKDSTSTKDSNYSVEATIDVAVHASQDSMPAGMAKVLEMLGSAMDLCDPNGELTVNETYFELAPGEKAAKLIVSYKTPKGIYDPKDVHIQDVDPHAIDEVTGTAVYMLSGSKTGITYTVGSKTSPRKVDVTVKSL